MQSSCICLSNKYATLKEGSKADRLEAFSIHIGGYSWFENKYWLYIMEVIEIKVYTKYAWYILRIFGPRYSLSLLVQSLGKGLYMTIDSEVWFWILYGRCTQRRWFAVSASHVYLSLCKRMLPSYWLRTLLRIRFSFAVALKRLVSLQKSLHDHTLFPKARLRSALFVLFCFAFPKAASIPVVSSIPAMCLIYLDTCNATV